jgi:hypothetical protein
MAKSYSEQLAEWIKCRPSTKRAKNVVAFLAVRDDVKEALEEGYAVKTVWAHMYESKRVGFGYDTFLNYVNRHLRRPEEQPAIAENNALRLPAAINKVRQREASNKATASAPASFTFNAAPNKEELL